MRDKTDAEIARQHWEVVRKTVRKYKKRVLSFVVSLPLLRCRRMGNPAKPSRWGYWIPVIRQREKGISGTNRDEAAEGLRRWMPNLHERDARFRCRAVIEALSRRGQFVRSVNMHDQNKDCGMYWVWLLRWIQWRLLTQPRSVTQSLNVLVQQAAMRRRPSDCSRLHRGRKQTRPGHFIELTNRSASNSLTRRNSSTASRQRTSRLQRGRADART